MDPIETPKAEAPKEDKTEAPKDIEALKEEVKPEAPKVVVETPKAETPKEESKPKTVSKEKPKAKAKTKSKEKTKSKAKKATAAAEKPKRSTRRRKVESDSEKSVTDSDTDDSSGSLKDFVASDSDVSDAEPAKEKSSDDPKIGTKRKASDEDNTLDGIDPANVLPPGTKRQVKRAKTLWEEMIEQSDSDAEFVKKEFVEDGSEGEFCESENDESEHGSEESTDSSFKPEETSSEETSTSDDE